MNHSPDPTDATGLIRLAAAELDAGNLAGAVQLADQARTAVAAGPALAEALVIRAQALLLQRDYGGAAQSAFTALQGAPDLAAARYLLAAAAGGIGLVDAAGAPITQAALLAEARQHHPADFDRHRHLFGDVNAYAHVDAARLEDAIRRARFRPEDYYAAIDAVARRDQGWLDMLARAGASGLTPFTLDPADITVLARLRPWLAYWSMQVNTDLVIEAVLGAARRHYADWLAQRRPGAPLPQPDVLLAIAAQCHLNEFIFEETAQEAALAARLADRLRSTGRLDDAELLVLGAYRDLVQADGIDGLDRAGLKPQATALLAMTVDDAAERREIAAGIPTVTGLDQGRSAEVRAFYEATPYPRWRQFARPPRTDRSFDQIMAEDAPYLLPGRRPVGTDLDVLIAGCGTGTAIVPALSYRGARVTAFDLSLPSLAYAKQRLTALGHEGIRYAQGDILAIGEMGAQFDVIECTGVLHHLDDPWPGVAALAGVLKPGGRAMLSVYSRPFRRMMAPFMENARRIERQTLGPVAAKVRAARRDLIRQRLAGAKSGFLFQGNDTFTTSGFRDLLLHPVERPQTVAEFAEGCARHGLACLGLIPTNLDQARLMSERGKPVDIGPEIVFWTEQEARNPLLFSTMICLFFEKIG